MSGAAFLCAAVFARADITTFSTPSFRGNPGTASAYCDIFTSPYGGANSPNGVAPGGIAIANAAITQTSDASAFLTGSGNIYDFANPTGFVLDYSGGFEVGQVVFQSRTLGSEIDYDSLFLICNSASGIVSLPATRNPLADPNGGVSSEWTWDLSSLGVSGFSIVFNASASSMSLDSVMLDAAAVPEPASAALLILFGVGLFRTRFSRCQ